MKASYAAFGGHLLITCLVLQHSNYASFAAKYPLPSNVANFAELIVSVI